MSYLDMTGLGANVGPTQTRGASPADVRAMNAPREKLPAMCAAGNALACELLERTSVPTEAEKEARRIERERQAQAERAGLARKAREAGLSPRLARAIEEARDVEYLEYPTGEGTVAFRERPRGRSRTPPPGLSLQNKLLIGLGVLGAAGLVLYAVQR